VRGGMGSDDPKHRRSYAAPPSVVLGGIFVMGIGMGVFLTLLAASAVPDKGARNAPEPTLPWRLRPSAGHVRQRARCGTPRIGL
jgi:hypothetical protein